METAAIRKIKRPDGSARWEGYVVAEDEFGTWAFSPRHTAVHWEKSGETGVTSWVESDVVVLLPKTEWYLVVWWATGETDVTVDVAMPPVFVNDEWQWIDLETDLWRDHEGEVGIVDEDEFEDACAAGHINPDERAAAIASARNIETMLRERIEPFGDVGRARLDDAVGLGLPPL